MGRPCQEGSSWRKAGEKRGARRCMRGREKAPAGRPWPSQGRWGGGRSCFQAKGGTSREAAGCMAYTVPRYVLNGIYLRHETSKVRI